MQDTFQGKQAMTNQAKGGRVAAVDMLRGLAVAMLMVNNAGDWSHVSPWLEHATWHGCQPADLFPCFLNLTGIGLICLSAGSCGVLQAGSGAACG
jgi:predicted acyltransferase